MPKSLVNSAILDEINRQSFSAKSTDIQYLSAVARQNDFANSVNVLSVFGGADITPVVLPKAKKVYILDRNNFLTKESLRSNSDLMTKDQDKNGLFHDDIAKLVLECSPHSYASMDNGADHDTPYGVLSLHMYHGSSYIEDSKSRLIQAIYKNYNEQNALSWSGKSVSQDFQYMSLGISTVLLTRLVVCCNAKILDVQEIIEDGVYQIDIQKQNGETCSVYYVQSELGNDQTVSNAAYQWLSKEMNEKGVDTVMSKGWPSSFFHTAPKGQIDKIKTDAQNLVKNVPVQTCAYVTVSGDACPPIFESSKAMVKYLNSGSQLQNLYVGSGQMIGASANNNARVVNALPFETGVGVSFSNASSSASNTTVQEDVKSERTVINNNI